MKSETVRRPEVLELAKKLQREHRDWSWDRCLIEAKIVVTSPKK